MAKVKNLNNQLFESYRDCLDKAVKLSNYLYYSDAYHENYINYAQYEYLKQILDKFNFTFSLYIKSMMRFCEDDLKKIALKTYFARENQIKLINPDEEILDEKGGDLNEQEVD